MVDGRVSLFLALVTILTASNYVRGHLTKDYTIQLLWNGQGLNQSDWVHFSIGESEDKDGVEINIDAPFYDDPAPPNAQPGTTNMAIPVVEFSSGGYKIRKIFA